MHPNKKHAPVAALVASLFTAVFPHAAAAADAADTELGQVVVTATRQATRSNELLSDVSVVTHEEIEQRGQTSLAEVLATLPGVFVTDGNTPGKQASVFIRGTNTGHALLLVDGMPLSSATLGQAPFDSIPASEIERIEVLRGPASSIYGSEAIGGVIQIFTKRGEGPAKVRLSARYGSFGSSDASVGVSGGSAALSYALSASALRSNGFSITRGPLSNPDRDGFSADSSSGSLQFRPATGHELGINFLQTTNTNHTDGNLNFDDRTDTRISSWSAYTKNRLTTDWTSTLRIGESNNESSTLRPGTIDRFKTTQRSYAWQNDISSAWGKWLLGAEQQEVDIDSTGSFVLKSRTTHAYQLGWNNTFGKHRLQANVRRDEISGIGDKETWLVGYGYQLTEHLRGFASTGTAFKAPSFNDLYFPTACFPIWGCFGGNPNLKPESAKNAEAGLAWQSGAHEAQVVYYDNQITDLIDWGSTPVNIGRARISGTTLSYRGGTGGWRWNSSLDLAQPRDEITGKTLRRRAEEQLQAGLAYQAGAWTLGGDLRAAGQRFDDASNLNRMGGFGVLNLYTRYAVEKDWTLEAQLKNAGDKEYELTRGSGNTQFVTAGRAFYIGLRYAPK
ncbi:MAG: TonB-dependent receptor [Rhodocyclaceae bacterium]